VSYSTQVMSSCGWSATADSRSKQHTVIILQTRPDVPGALGNNNAEPQLKCRPNCHGGEQQCPTTLMAAPQHC
jgi:hypothetical protein